MSRICLSMGDRTNIWLWGELKKKLHTLKTRKSLQYFSKWPSFFWPNWICKIVRDLGLSLSNNRVKASGGGRGRVRAPAKKIVCTVKLGYNELGYNKHSVITNKNIYLVGLGHFPDKFSWL